MAVFIAVSTFAQGYTPMRGSGISANGVNLYGICVGCYNGNLNALVDADLNNTISMGNFVAVASGSGVSVKNTFETYPAGTITGFKVDTNSSLLTVNLLGALRIETYKAGIRQESSTSISLISAPLIGGAKNGVFLNFTTTKAFDEVRLFQADVVSLFSSLKVYYAFAFDPGKMLEDNNGICDDIIAGSGVDGTVSASSSFLAPLSYVPNRERIGDGDKKSFGRIALPIGVLGSFSVGLLDKDNIYPAGNKAGFVISPDDENKILSVEILKNLTVETYLFGQLQDSRTMLDAGGLLNIKVLADGSGKQKISLITTKPFNEIRLRVNQTVGVNIGTLKVYYAFEEPQIGCECNSKVQTGGSAVQGNIKTGFGWTSQPNFFALLIAKMNNLENIVDQNPDNFATATLPLLSILGISTSFVTVETATMQPAHTFAGFTIKKSANILGHSILPTITVQLFNNNTLSDVFLASASLISGNILTAASGKFEVGGVATMPFNRIKIVFSNGTGGTIFQQYEIYNAFASKDSDGDGVPDCFDLCPNGDDNIDTNGNGIPDCAETTCSGITLDKTTADTDGDGIADACDSDSDNDGILDTVENANENDYYEDDDYDILFESPTVYAIANYKDLASDNDGILDLFKSGISNSIINIIDKDKNGVIDADIALGSNGFADILETSPDSGIANYTIKNTDGDGNPDILDLTSNGSAFDLYVIGKGDFDTTGGGFISRGADADSDGIQNQVDTDLIVKGSPLSPYDIAMIAGKMTPDVATANDVKVYSNPVKAAESLHIQTNKSDVETVYNVYSAQGQLVKSAKFTGNGAVSTSSLTTGVYIVKTQSGNLTKSYKVIVK